MKNFFLFTALLLSIVAFSQKKQNPLIVLDAKKIGFMLDISKEMEAINPDDISTLTVYKDSLISKRYDSNSGVIVITTKKFILNTFYKNNIENSPLKTIIASPEDLLKIGVLTDHPESKNQPYDELQKYIDTYTLSDKIKKVASIIFIKPSDSEKINPEWKFGALDINAEIDN
jgi:hypothetical protein